MRLRRPFLHDGSAATIEEAIARHRGEVATTIGRYQAVSAAERAALLEYLRSL